MATEVQKITTFKVAATYIGTIVGAGFASGQEVMQYFSFFGLGGLIALAAATLMFIFFGIIILELGHGLRAKSHREVIQHAGGRWVGSAVDAVITFFLFGAMTAMAAGSGAIFAQQFGFSHFLGSLVMVTATVFTVLLGIHGVITAISFVVPFLLAAVLGISIASLISTPPNALSLAQWSRAAQSPVPFWPLSAIVYVSYNLVLGVAVLAPLGRLAGDNAGVLRKGALYGGIGLGIGALAINLALLSSPPAVSGYEIPMARIAARFSPLIQTAYSIVLLAEIYTTAMGSLYGFTARIMDPEARGFRWLVIGSGIASLAAGQLGFSTLVRVLYSAVGYAGLLMLAGLTYGYFRERLAVRPAFKPGPEDDK
ncbi:MAG: hypothetical protein K6T65_04490 [Peptococcaceae bacterium]|nr:hypothetical protein [Peptococcaceae bacterium]